MRKIVHAALAVFIALAFVMAPSFSAAQDVLVNKSYNYREDSLFFAKMNRKMDEIRKERPTVALVLAGGGAKGAAHIGVLKYLEERGIPVDFVAGTSIGALVGGLYSMGYSAFEIDTIVRAIDWNVMMSDKIPMEYYSYNMNVFKRKYLVDIPFEGNKFLRSLPSGYLYGLNVYNILSALSVGYQGDVDFSELPTPFCCIATEIVSQTEKRWTSGSIIDAMRSTMSIPGYFRPVRVDSMILSDGGTKNNFPTDIAKAAGADIIIGVELTMPRDYSGVNNVVDIIIQTTQYSGSLEAHIRNIENATVYITPDISGYRALSFGSDEIETLIRRGYTEAKKHAAELDSIAALVGREGRQLHNKHAINTTNTPVKINSVRVNGVNAKERRFIDRKLRLKYGNYYGRDEFEIDQSIIYGTKAFSDVTYRLVESGNDGYDLVFNCNKRPVNSFSAGVRADSEDWFSILLSAGFGRNKICGSYFDITARLAMSPYLMLNWAYQPVFGPKFGASLKAEYQLFSGSNNSMFSRSFYDQSMRGVIDIYLESNHWSRVDLLFGARAEYMPFHRSISESGVTETRDWKTVRPYAYLRFVFDNEDDHYFPTKGLCVNAGYDYNFKNTHFVMAGISGAIQACSFFHILPSLNARFILGETNEYSYMDNYVGGSMPGRHFDHQLLFMGLNGEMRCMEYLAVADIDLRFKIARKFFLSGIVSAMHDGNKYGMREHAIHGAALKLAYKSKLGPISTNLHWNSYTRKFGFYVSAGYDF
ncbi:MAG: patatin-like phospholipase family protein [Bacteroidales bacterium]|nr:patatin-like phospholipase family protein [Bacteroidales bacterium]